MVYQKFITTLNCKCLTHRSERLPDLCAGAACVSSSADCEQRMKLCLQVNVLLRRTETRAGRSSEALVCGHVRVESLTHDAVGAADGRRVVGNAVSSRGRVEAGG